MADDTFGTTHGVGGRFDPGLGTTMEEAVRRIVREEMERARPASGLSSWLCCAGYTLAGKTVTVLDDDGAISVVIAGVRYPVVAKP